MGIATIHKNKIDDSTVWRFERTWIEFHPALNKRVKKIYIPNALADMLMTENRWRLYDMFNSNESLKEEYTEVA